MNNIGFVKRLVLKSALGIARMFVTPELIKEEVRKALSDVAARAHSGDRTRFVLERTNAVVAAMSDGVVNVEEVEQILGDIVTEENVAKAFDYIERKVTK